MIRPARLLPLFAAGLALIATRPTSGEHPLVVRADPALRTVLTSAIRSFEAAGGGAVVLETGPLRLDETADVVAGQGPTMTRLLENGPADLSQEVLLPPIRWVLVGRRIGPVSLQDAPSVRVPSGDLGAAARRGLARLGVRRIRTALETDPYDDLALVPESLAEGRPSTPVDLEPLLMSIAPMRTSSRREAAELFVAHLAKTIESASGSITEGARETAVALPPCTGTLASMNAVAVVDWWIPQASLAVNRYNNPQEGLGSPNASGNADVGYQGFVSLGAAGYVTLDMGGCVPDGPGPDIRVHQAIASEPVTLYASALPSGPFVRLGYRVTCTRNCDFDFADAEGPLQSVRYLKVEDGELFASSGAGGSNGADLDAVRAFHIQR